MKRFKKLLTSIISMVLVIAMVGTSCVFATDTHSENIRWNSMPKYASFVYQGHGEFSYDGIASEDVYISNVIELSEIKPGVEIVAELDASDIYILSNGKYLVHANDFTFTLADKLVIDHLNPEESLLSYSSFNIPASVSDDVLNDIRSHNGYFEDGYEYSLFVPATIPELINEKKLYQRGLGGGDTDCFYTYMDFQLHNIVAKQLHNNTGMNQYVAGSNTTSVMDAITTILLTAAGVMSNAVSITAGGLSVLDILLSDHSTIVQSSNNNNTASMNYIFTKYTKYVYVDTGTNWVFGLKTYAAKSERTDHYYYEGSTSNAWNSSRAMTERYEALYYSSPAAVAVAWADEHPNLCPYVVSRIYVKMYNLTVLLP